MLLLGGCAKNCQRAYPEKLGHKSKGEYDDNSLKPREFLIIYPDISVDGIGGSSLILNKWILSELIILRKKRMNKEL